MAAKASGLKLDRSKTWQYLFIGVLILVGGFVMYAIFIKPKTQTGTNANGIATDANGQPQGYIPTSTSFTNLNINEGNTTTNTTNAPVTTTTTTTGSDNSGGTTVINPPPPPPPSNPTAPP